MKKLTMIAALFLLAPSAVAASPSHVQTHEIADLVSRAQKLERTDHYEDVRSERVRLGQLLDSVITGKAADPELRTMQVQSLLMRANAKLRLAQSYRTQFMALVRLHEANRLEPLQDVATASVALVEGVQ